MESIGQTLRTERELKHISLEEMAQTTRIPLRSLQLIEDDKLDALPGDVFARGFVKSYAQALGIPSEPLVARLGADRSFGDDFAVVGIVGEPERARRVGVAVAMVILLFLFTLALSIVLRPRRNDRPAELSQNAPAQTLPAGDHDAAFG